MSESIKADINNVCLSNNNSCGSFYDHTVYCMNVVNAIRSLCVGKSDGVDVICSANLKHATDRFIVSLFDSILPHGCVPSRFCSTTIIHMPKTELLYLVRVFNKIVIEKQVQQIDLATQLKVLL